MAFKETRQIGTGFGKVNFDMFFDRELVVDRWGKKKVRILSNTGSFGRGVMRRGIRPGGKKGKNAEQGEIPRWHERGFGSLKDGIFFSADFQNDQVVIGANKLKTEVSPLGGMQSSAQVLNEGGRGVIIVKRFNKPNKRGIRKPPRQTVHRAKWQGNNFTQPAFEPTLKRFRENIEKFEL